MDSSEQNESQPGQQNDYFQVRLELAGSLRSGKQRSDVNQRESSNSRRIRSNGGQTNDETGLVTEIIDASVQNQAGNQALDISSQAVDQSVIECGERRRSYITATTPIRRMTDNHEENSPTAYDPKRMPRTLGASSFTMTVLRAQGIRTQIRKISGNIEEYIEDIKEMEAEGTVESNHFFKRWEESNREFNRIEELKNQHEELVSQVRLMCGYLISTGTEETKSDATEELARIETAETDVDTRVKEFKKKNKKYLVGKKRKATEQTVEDDQTRNAARGINSNWYLQMAGKMEPEGTLKNNAGLT